MRLLLRGTATVALLGTGCSSELAPTGACDITSGFAGDEACLEPPDPSEGIQIHVGPSNYDDEEELRQWLVYPGEDYEECFMLRAPVDDDVYYREWELSGRPGTHHIINTQLADAQPNGWAAGCEQVFTGGEALAGLPGANQPQMPRAPTAPENENLGLPLYGRGQIQSQLHYFNATSEPILREFWLNLYTVDEVDVEEVPRPLVGIGGLGFRIQPGTHDVYRYECPVRGDGRIIRMIGHTHAHGIRETAWIRRGETRTKVFEQYNYLEPAIFYYDSITENPPFSDTQAGATSGLLEVQDGDVLEWECEVLNDSENTLTFANDVNKGEMCNVFGSIVGADIYCLLQ